MAGDASSPVGLLTVLYLLISAPYDPVVFARVRELVRWLLAILLAALAVLLAWQLPLAELVGLLTAG
ncbi:hypothetical protein [Pseudonocardia sp. KRD291]|uniref:hypothetical protein n=1 Tax=Pseudonocardia sp. KRD291 TaxID=2792007 RepID=UPI001C49CFD2|nr:hypothetical protein [Pseudonocardia sp. KRD291]MBW0101524.1 hypothetical protein [Pseudonocardia sp. KRD291]